MTADLPSAHPPTHLAEHSDAENALRDALGGRPLAVDPAAPSHGPRPLPCRPGRPAQVVLPERTRVAIAGAGSASAVRSRTEAQPRVWRPCRPGLSPGFAASPVPDRCQPGRVNGGVRVPGGRGHERVHQQVHVAHMAHARITGRPLNLNSPFEWICWHFSCSGPY